MGFSEGAARGAQTATNPFGLILSGMREEQAQRKAEDNRRKEKEGELEKALMLLGQKDAYDRALEQEKQKTEIFEQGGTRVEQPQSLPDQFGIKAPQGQSQVQAGQSQGSQLLSTVGLERQTKTRKVGDELFSVPESDVSYDRRLGIEKKKIDINKELKEIEKGKPLTDSQLEKINESTKVMNEITENLSRVAKNKDLLSEFMGPQLTFAPVKRFFSKFSDDPKSQTVRAITSAIEQTGNVYRVSITGVQAGFKEIRFIRDNFPTTDDKINTFLSKSYLTSKTAFNALERQIPFMQAAGKDVSALKEIKNQAQKQLEISSRQIDSETLQNLDKQWDSQGFIRAGEGATFDSVEEAEKANLPLGTKVIVGTDMFEVR